MRGQERVIIFYSDEAHSHNDINALQQIFPALNPQSYPLNSLGDSIIDLFSSTES